MNSHQKIPVKILIGSSANFKCIPEPGCNYFNRPLVVDAWSQTEKNDFIFLKEIEIEAVQTQREKELEEKVKLLQENLRLHAELLSQIHATSAKTSALLSQEQVYQHQEQKAVQISANQTSTVAQFAHIVNNNSLPVNAEVVNSVENSPINCVINPSKVNCDTSESVKYTIIAEGTEDQNGEPIEIQLAEDDEALNLNSSTDSGRLEICLAPEDNVEIKTEFDTPNTLNSSIERSTSTEHHLIKRQKISVDQHETLPAKSNCLFNGEDALTAAKIKQKPAIQKRRINNSLLKTPKVTNNSNCISEDLSVNGYDNEEVMVSLGPNDTRIPAKVIDNMNWTSASIATRKLLMAAFDRKILATHSMTGKPSPAFKDHGKPLKEMLDPKVISDIIFAVTRKCNVTEKEVRNAITTKCADENKMMKQRMKKRKAMLEINKENTINENSLKN